MRARLCKKKNMSGLDRHTRFISAALEGNYATMRRLLATGHDINSANDEGETAFSWCCQYNKIRSAQFLYRNGADINLLLSGGITPLDVAYSWASPAFRKWLESVGGERKTNYEAHPWPPAMKLTIS